MRVSLVLALMAVLLFSAGCDSDLTTFRSMNVQAALTDIHKAALNYQRDYNGWPGSFETLEELGYIELEAKIRERWKFEVLTEEILAISTDEMPDGAGHEVVFNFGEDRFYGYGIKETGGWR